jgi:hypothetical protein
MFNILVTLEIDDSEWQAAHSGRFNPGEDTPGRLERKSSSRQTQTPPDPTTGATISSFAFLATRVITAKN